MKICYFDCHSGIGGDMLLGALVDLGLPIRELQKVADRLGIEEGCKVTAKIVRRGALAGTKVDVHPGRKAGRRTAHKSSHRNHDHPPARAFSEIKKLIERADLSAGVKRHAVAIFADIAKAEAEVHRTRIENIHFHEVGAVDSIIDIVGGAYGLEWLGAEEVYASPLNTGEGTVMTEHGVLPVPAPATLKLLRGVPCYSSGVKKEMVTPTGAALIRHFAKAFVSLPEMTVSASGYGAGSHVLKEAPNLLRVIVGERSGRSVLGGDAETVWVVETNIDDMNPEIYEHVMEALFKAGAVDVCMTPIQMKKNRPAVKLTALVPERGKNAVVRVLLTETTSFGVRLYPVERVTLHREWRTLKTPLGPVKFKIGRLGDEQVQCAPEYEECKKIARLKKLPLKTVYEILLRSALLA
jgi:hypothetical protein